MYWDTRKSEKIWGVTITDIFNTVGIVTGHGNGVTITDSDYNRCDYIR